MPFYPDSETLYGALTELFNRTLADPAGQKELQGSGMVFRLDLSDPAAIVTINGKARPVALQWGPDGRRADLVIHAPGDVLHQVCLKEVRLRDAFFGGKMKVDGSTFRALRLEGLFHVLQAQYPQVLRDRGLLPVAS
jgi:putative sterol carrier protein